MPPTISGLFDNGFYTFYIKLVRSQNCTTLILHSNKIMLKQETVKSMKLCGVCILLVA